jgi:prepilin-type N-terminal cleavage/methylation domain-containing protein
MFNRIGTTLGRPSRAARQNASRREIAGGAGRRSGAGFTLIETLVALTIMSFSMSAIYSVMSGSYKAAARAKSAPVALALTRSHLDSIGRALPIQLGTASGTYPNGMTWRLTVETLPGETPGTGTQPYWVSLETFDRSGSALLKLETLKVGEAS